MAVARDPGLDRSAMAACAHSIACCTSAGSRERNSTGSECETLMSPYMHADPSWPMMIAVL